ncbi:uncharacterized protein LOC129278113 [Lytechinus pictus]|uniref:uncharacterized protein LOC129278113 n=1 Tax=Lytechinus pictus TaxID=7653 RepID=UPI0030B9B97E
MSVGKSESLLRRDARAFCNKSNQRTIWEARRDERRTNQQLERELRHIERSKSYRERELDRDQVKFLNNFVEIFQRQCDIVAQRKSHPVDVETIHRDEHEDEPSQYDTYDEYLDGGPDTMTITTSDQATTEAATSGVQDKSEENPEILLVAEMNRRKLRLHRDSLLPIIYSPCPSEDSTPKYSSRPNSPRPLVISPSEAHFSMSDQDSEAKKSEEKIISERTSPDHDSPRSAANRSPPRDIKVNVSAPVYRRRLSPLNRFKIPESHFRAESPSSKNSTIFVNDVPDLGGSVRGDRIHRRGRKPLPPTYKSKLRSSKMGHRSLLDSQKKRRGSTAEGNDGAPMDEMALNTKFMLEFEEASRNALDPYASGVDIESIRKQFLVNTLAKKLKISALRSGHFAELDDIRKKIERRRKCVEEILEAKRKARMIAKAKEMKENGEDDTETNQEQNAE